MALAEPMPADVLHDPRPEELTAPERVELYISKSPETKGVYGGNLPEAGIYINPEIIPDYTGEMNELPQVVEMELLPGAQLGAGDSHHEVLFGDALVRVGDRESVVGVAIKEYEFSTRGAEIEYANLIEASRRGFDTFQPLALATDEDKTWLVTAYRPDLTTLDNADWSILPGDQARYEKEVLPNLRFLVQNLAALHSRGIFHGDVVPKNMARTDTGNFVVTDLEGAFFANDADEHEVMLSGGGEIRESKALLDITHLWRGMTHRMREDAGNIFLEDASYETCMQEFERALLRPYLNALQAATPAKVLSEETIHELADAAYKYAEQTT